MQAVIDIGTNTIRLLVAEKTADGFRTVGKTLRTTRLGDGLSKGEKLSEAASRRTLEGLAELQRQGREWGATEWTAIATEALREAADGAEFAAAAERLLGVPVRIISGEEEARYGYLGASGCTGKLTTVVDIGGGSTEISVGLGGDIGLVVSMPVGAVRGTRDFDMMTRRGIGELKKHCFALFQENTEQMEPVAHWIGIGGTWTSLVTIQEKMEAYDASRVQGYVLTAAQVTELQALLASLSYEERLQLPGLDPERADIIVAGAVIAAGIMEYFALPEISISDADILEGAWQETYRS